MIRWATTGDMFDEAADAYVNTVNCVGVMGKGIALQFKAKFPKMFVDYPVQCRNGMQTPGSVMGHMATRNGRDIWILNFATKDHWRNPSPMEYIELGLKDLKQVSSLSA